MTKDATKEAIAVMQAYVDGKRIQWKHAICGDAWQDCSGEPSWALTACAYRIAPEPKYRPYNSPSEVPIGARVRLKPSGGTYMIWDAGFWSPESLGVIRVGIVNPHGYRDVGVATLFADYEFLDGKPCGVLEGGVQKPLNAGSSASGTSRRS